MRTVYYRRLIAHTLHVVQPDRSGPSPVEISKYSAIVPEIHKRKKIKKIQCMHNAYSHILIDMQPVETHRQLRQIGLWY